MYFLHLISQFVPSTCEKHWFFPVWQQIFIFVANPVKISIPVGMCPFWEITPPSMNLNMKFSKFDQNIKIEKSIENFHSFFKPLFSPKKTVAQPLPPAEGWVAFFFFIWQDPWWGERGDGFFSIKLKRAKIFWARCFQKCKNFPDKKYENRIRCSNSYLETWLKKIPKCKRRVGFLWSLNYITK